MAAPLGYYCNQEIRSPKIDAFFKLHSRGKADLWNGGRPI